MEETSMFVILIPIIVIAVYFAFKAPTKTPVVIVPPLPDKEKVVIVPPEKQKDGITETFKMLNPYYPYSYDYPYYEYPYTYDWSGLGYKAAYPNYGGRKYYNERGHSHGKRCGGKCG